MRFVGRSGSNSLFVSNGRGAVIDEGSLLVLSVDNEKSFSTKFWSSDDYSPCNQAVELANAALTELDIEVLSTNERMHTIPKAVQEEARRALEWRKEFKRGGTPVGLNTARTLAKGGQIGIKKIRHIAKYFPRHEVDKKGQGYSPGEKGYPSKGRIAWALWGGDAAKRWASAIVERENKKENSSLIASNGYYDFEMPPAIDFDSFKSVQPSFMARIRLDGSGVDRLYCIHGDGTVLVWDDGCWDNLGNICHDLHTYDKTLDDPYDTVEKFHVPIDKDAAITLAALFDASPFGVTSLEKVAPEESELFRKARYEMDFSIVDAIVAASQFKTNKDGTYTKQERSEKATGQLRDALGRFAVTGSRVVVGGDPNLKGKIVSQDQATQNVRVELDNGKTIDIAANKTQQEDTVAPVSQEKELNSDNEELSKENLLDLSGILGEPRSPKKYAARLPEFVTPLTSETLSNLLNDFSGWVSSQRANKKSDSVDKQPDTSGTSDKNSKDFWYLDAEYESTSLPNAADVPALKNFLKDPKNESLYKNSSSEKDSPVVSAAEPPQSENYDNPRQSDVAPIYMALVAEDDPQAVMDLIALVPKGPNTTAPMVFKRTPGEWVADEKILQDLNSPTPPPVVVLDNKVLEDVVKQIDGPEIEAQRQMAQRKNTPVTAGGYFTGGPNERRLRDYWVKGQGSSKIRWNSPGAMDRCLERVSMHLGPRAKAYCALRMKDVLGTWESEAITASSQSDSDLPSEQEVVEFIELRSRRIHALQRITASGVAYDVNQPSSGARFVIPLVIPEGVESGDGRMFEKGAITIRDLPLPLLWQIKTGEGHNGSIVVGRIDRMVRTDDGIGNAYGVFDSGPYGKEAERLVKNQFIRGVSADLDQFEADEEIEEKENGEDGKISNGKMKIKKARVMAVTLVPKPAFQECRIELVSDSDFQEEQVVPDGVYVEDMDSIEASALIACGIVAGVIPVNPPSEWFDNPGLKEATPLTVSDDGRVFGHIASWHMDHIGMSFGTRPPRSRSQYAYFHTGVVQAENGSTIPVGQLTLAGGHASLEASAQEAVRHYDDTASAIADVHAGEDSYGIWVAGALRPGTTPEQIRALRASAPSGDWRPIKGHLELVAVCQVNVPGFPIARARVASGQVMALVAAGAQVLARMKNDPIADLNARIAKLEEIKTVPMIAAIDSAKSRVMAVKAEELSNKMRKAKKDMEDESDYMLHGVDDGDASSELAVIPRKLRKKLAEQGKALPNGSFPIRNVSDLRNAVQAYGRAKVGSRALVRRHIVKRAKALNRPDLVPQDWKEASLDEIPQEGITASTDNPCWDGYVMVGMKTVDGKEVPNCVPSDEAGVSDPFVASLRERALIAQAMIAAGGLDRNRGNAERLRRYWTKGEGALKIRWGTPGDWKRCVRYLSKYMGVRAKGYCQLRHKEATGVYTGSRFNPGRNNSLFSAFSEEDMGLFESFYGSPENYFTSVSQEDMMIPLDSIMGEPDENHDYSWAPPSEIVILIKDCGYTPYGGPEVEYEDDSYDSEDDSETNSKDVR